MLDCCEPLEIVKEKGISFGKLVCLAHCSGAKVEAFRTSQCTIDDFRKFVMTCSSSEKCHIISAYDRGVFKQVTITVLLGIIHILKSVSLTNLIGYCRLDLVTFHLSVDIVLKEIWF